MNEPGAHECRSDLDIPVPLEQAWAVLADFARWGEWNSFVVEVRGAERPQLGLLVHLDVRWHDGGKVVAAEEIVEVIDEPTRKGFRWDYRGLPARLGLVRGSRLIVLEARGPQACCYHSYERFRGPFVGFLSMAKIQDGFDRMATGLAKACASTNEPSGSRLG